MMEVALSMDEQDGGPGTVVKRLSVPVGLEELMSSLTKEVLQKKPGDIYSFASDHFAKLLALRDSGSYQQPQAKSIACTYTGDEGAKKSATSPLPGKPFPRQVSIRVPSPTRKSGQRIKRIPTPKHDGNNNVDKQDRKKSYTRKQTPTTKNKFDNLEAVKEDSCKTSTAKRPSLSRRSTDKATLSSDSSRETKGSWEESDKKKRGSRDTPIKRKPADKRIENVDRSSPKKLIVKERSGETKDGTLIAKSPKMLKERKSPISPAMNKSRDGTLHRHKRQVELNEEAQTPENQYDPSALREELQKVEEEANLNNFTSSYNPYKLRQEIKEASNDSDSQIQNADEPKDSSITLEKAVTSNGDDKEAELVKGKTSEAKKESKLKSESSSTELDAVETSKHDVVEKDLEIKPEATKATEESAKPNLEHSGELHDLVIPADEHKFSKLQLPLRVTEEAATKIQAGVRGYLTRKQYKDKITSNNEKDKTLTDEQLSSALNNIVIPTESPYPGEVMVAPIEKQRDEDVKLVKSKSLPGAHSGKIIDLGHLRSTSVADSVISKTLDENDERIDNVSELSSSLDHTEDLGIGSEMSSTHQTEKTTKSTEEPVETTEQNESHGVKMLGRSIKSIVEQPLQEDKAVLGLVDVQNKQEEGKDKQQKEEINSEKLDDPKSTQNQMKVQDKDEEKRKGEATPYIDVVTQNESETTEAIEKELKYSSEHQDIVPSQEAKKDLQSNNVKKDEDVTLQSTDEKLKHSSQIYDTMPSKEIKEDLGDGKSTQETAKQDIVEDNQLDKAIPSGDTATKDNLVTNKLINGLKHSSELHDVIPLQEIKKEKEEKSLEEIEKQNNVDDNQQGKELTNEDVIALNLPESANATDKGLEHTSELHDVIPIQETEKDLAKIQNTKKIDLKDEKNLENMTEQKKVEHNKQHELPLDAVEKVQNESEPTQAIDKKLKYTGEFHDSIPLGEVKEDVASERAKEADKKSKKSVEELAKEDKDEDNKQEAPSAANVIVQNESESAKTVDEGLEHTSELHDIIPLQELEGHLLQSENVDEMDLKNEKSTEEESVQDNKQVEAPSDLDISTQNESEATKATDKGLEHTSELHDVIPVGKVEKILVHGANVQKVELKDEESAEEDSKHDKTEDKKQGESPPVADVIAQNEPEASKATDKGLEHTSELHDVIPIQKATADLLHSETAQKMDLKDEKSTGGALEKSESEDNKKSEALLDADVAAQNEPEAAKATDKGLEHTSELHDVIPIQKATADLLHSETAQKMDLKDEKSTGGALEESESEDNKKSEALLDADVAAQNEPDAAKATDKGLEHTSELHDVITPQESKEDLLESEKVEKTDLKDEKSTEEMVKVEDGKQNETQPNIDVIVENESEAAKTTDKGLEQTSELHDLLPIQKATADLLHSETGQKMDLKDEKSINGASEESESEDNKKGEALLDADVATQNEPEAAKATDKGLEHTSELHDVITRQELKEDLLESEKVEKTNVKDEKSTEEMVKVEDSKQNETQPNIDVVAENEPKAAKATDKGLEHTSELHDVIPIQKATADLLYSETVQKMDLKDEKRTGGALEASESEDNKKSEALLDADVATQNEPEAAKATDKGLEHTSELHDVITPQESKEDLLESEKVEKTDLKYEKSTEEMVKVEDGKQNETQPNIDVIVENESEAAKTTDKGLERTSELHDVIPIQKATADLLHSETVQKVDLKDEKSMNGTSEESESEDNKKGEALLDADVATQNEPEAAKATDKGLEHTSELHDVITPQESKEDLLESEKVEKTDLKDEKSTEEIVKVEDGKQNETQPNIDVIVENESEAAKTTDKGLEHTGELHDVIPIQKATADLLHSETAQKMDLKDEKSTGGALEESESEDNKKSEALLDADVAAQNEPDAAKATDKGLEHTSELHDVITPQESKEDLLESEKVEKTDLKDEKSTEEIVKVEDSKQNETQPNIDVIVENESEAAKTTSKELEHTNELHDVIPIQKAKTVLLHSENVPKINLKDDESIEGASEEFKVEDNKKSEAPADADLTAPNESEATKAVDAVLQHTSELHDVIPIQKTETVLLNSANIQKMDSKDEKSNERASEESEIEDNKKGEAPKDADALAENEPETTKVLQHTSEVHDVMPLQKVEKNLLHSENVKKIDLEDKKGTEEESKQKIEDSNQDEATTAAILENESEVTKAIENKLGHTSEVHDSLSLQAVEGDKKDDNSTEEITKKDKDNLIIQTELKTAEAEDEKLEHTSELHDAIPIQNVEADKLPRENLEKLDLSNKKNTEEVSKQDKIENNKQDEALTDVNITAQNEPEATKAVHKGLEHIGELHRVISLQEEDKVENNKQSKASTDAYVVSQNESEATKVTDKSLESTSEPHDVPIENVEEVVLHSKNTQKMDLTNEKSIGEESKQHQVENNKQGDAPPDVDVIAQNASEAIKATYKGLEHTSELHDVIPPQGLEEDLLQSRNAEKMDLKNENQDKVEDNKQGEVQSEADVIAQNESEAPKVTDEGLEHTSEYHDIIPIEKVEKVLLHGENAEKTNCKNDTKETAKQGNIEDIKQGEASSDADVGAQNESKATKTTDTILPHISEIHDIIPLQDITEDVVKNESVDETDEEDKKVIGEVAKKNKVEDSKKDETLPNVNVTPYSKLEVLDDSSELHDLPSLQVKENLEKSEQVEKTDVKNEITEKNEMKGNEQAEALPNVDVMAQHNEAIDKERHDTMPMKEDNVENVKKTDLKKEKRLEETAKSDEVEDNSQGKVTNLIDEKNTAKMSEQDNKLSDTDVVAQSDKELKHSSELHGVIPLQEIKEDLIQSKNVEDLKYEKSAEEITKQDEVEDNKQDDVTVQDESETEAIDEGLKHTSEFHDVISLQEVKKENEKLEIDIKDENSPDKIAKQDEVEDKQLEGSVAINEGLKHTSELHDVIPLEEVKRTNVKETDFGDDQVEDNKQSEATSDTKTILQNESESTEAKEGLKHSSGLHDVIPLQKVKEELVQSKDVREMDLNDTEKIAKQAEGKDNRRGEETSDTDAITEDAAHDITSLQELKEDLVQSEDVMKPNLKDEERAKELEKQDKVKHDETSEIVNDLHDEEPLQKVKQAALVENIKGIGLQAEENAGDITNDVKVEDIQQNIQDKCEMIQDQVNVVDESVGSKHVEEGLKHSSKVHDITPIADQADEKNKQKTTEASVEDINEEPLAEDKKVALIENVNKAEIETKGDIEKLTCGVEVERDTSSNDKDGMIQDDSGSKDVEDLEHSSELHDIIPKADIKEDVAPKENLKKEELKPEQDVEETPKQPNVTDNQRGEITLDTNATDKDEVRNQTDVKDEPEVKDGLKHSSELHDVIPIQEVEEHVVLKQAKLKHEENVDETGIKGQTSDLILSNQLSKDIHSEPRTFSEEKEGLKHSSELHDVILLQEDKEHMAQNVTLNKTELKPKENIEDEEEQDKSEDIQQNTVASDGHVSEQPFKDNLKEKEKKEVEGNQQSTTKSDKNVKEPLLKEESVISEEAEDLKQDSDHHGSFKQKEQEGKESIEAEPVLDEHQKQAIVKSDSKNAKVTEDDFEGSELEEESKTISDMNKDDKPRKTKNQITEISKMLNDDLNIEEPSQNIKKAALIKKGDTQEIKQEPSEDEPSKGHTNVNGKSSKQIKEIADNVEDTQKSIAASIEHLDFEEGEQDPIKEKEHDLEHSSEFHDIIPLQENKDASDENSKQAESEATENVSKTSTQGKDEGRDEEVSVEDMGDQSLRELEDQIVVENKEEKDDLVHSSEVDKTLTDKESTEQQNTKVLETQNSYEESSNKDKKFPGDASQLIATSASQEQNHENEIGVPKETTLSQLQYDGGRHDSMVSDGTENEEQTKGDEEVHLSPNQVQTVDVAKGEIASATKSSPNQPYTSSVLDKSLELEEEAPSASKEPSSKVENNSNLASEHTHNEITNTKLLLDGDTNLANENLPVSYDSKKEQRFHEKDDSAKNISVDGLVDESKQDMKIKDEIDVTQLEEPAKEIPLPNASPVKETLEEEINGKFGSGSLNQKESNQEQCGKTESDGTSGKDVDIIGKGDKEELEKTAATMKDDGQNYDNTVQHGTSLTTDKLDGEINKGSTPDKIDIGTIQKSPELKKLEHREMSEELGDVTKTDIKTLENQPNQTFDDNSTETIDGSSQGTLRNKMQSPEKSTEDGKSDEKLPEEPVQEVEGSAEAQKGAVVTKSPGLISDQSSPPAAHLPSRGADRESKNNSPDESAVAVYESAPTRPGTSGVTPNTISSENTHIPSGGLQEVLNPELHEFQEIKTQRADASQVDDSCNDQTADSIAKPENREFSGASVPLEVIKNASIDGEIKDNTNINEDEIKKKDHDDTLAPIEIDGKETEKIPILPSAPPVDIMDFVDKDTSDLHSKQEFISHKEKDLDDRVTSPVTDSHKEKDVHDTFTPESLKEKAVYDTNASFTIDSHEKKYLDGIITSSTTDASKEKDVHDTDVSSPTDSHKENDLDDKITSQSTDPYKEKSVHDTFTPLTTESIKEKEVYDTNASPMVDSHKENDLDKVTSPATDPYKEKSVQDSFTPLTIESATEKEVYDTDVSTPVDFHEEKYLYGLVTSPTTVGEKDAHDTDASFTIDSHKEKDLDDRVASPPTDSHKKKSHVIRSRPLLLNLLEKKRYIMQMPLLPSILIKKKKKIYMVQLYLLLPLLPLTFMKKKN